MVFLTVARVLYDKGYSELVSVATKVKKEYSNTVFRWVGSIDCEYPNYVPEDTVTSDVMKGAIQYLGFKTDVIDTIKKSDCIVLPSYHEGMSRSLMEALALGKPIITTDIPGCREMVEEGINGYLCKPRDAHSLENVIKKFMKLSNSERAKMGLESRKIAEKRFDVNNVIKLYDNVVSGLISNVYSPSHPDNSFRI